MICGLAAYSNFIDTYHHHYYCYCHYVLPFLLPQYYPQSIPKDLLQTSLRPVLKNLTQVQKLSIPIIQGLGRLLVLLSNWFNVTLGDKLHHYLSVWQQPEKLQAYNDPKGWRTGEEPDIAAAIIGLFHLLPASPKFLQPLVETSIKLNACLHRYKGYSRPNSPYLVPLTKYLAHYSKETVLFFLSKEKLLDSQ
jgi:transformation/transcription domain-associated protein